MLVVVCSPFLNIECCQILAFTVYYDLVALILRWSVLLLCTKMHVLSWLGLLAGLPLVEAMVLLDQGEEEAHARERARV